MAKNNALKKGVLNNKSSATIKRANKDSSNIKRTVTVSNNPKTNSTTIAKARRKSKGDFEDVLVENFVSLQKVMTNLSTRFDDLSTQISKLLELFEISAKTIAEKGGKGLGGDSGNMEEKLDNLVEQNKVIARGLTLLHERNSQEFNPSQPQRPPQASRPMPQQKQAPQQRMKIPPQTQHQQGQETGQQAQKKGPNINSDYQKSMSTHEDGSQNDNQRREQERR